MVVYKNLQFPFSKKRPYFFSNFVTSIDGRSVIKNKTDYPSLGSQTDFDTFIDLRSYADALIHGKHTAALHRTVDTISEKAFLQKRKKRKKAEILPYFIIANSPDASLLPALINNPMQKPYVITNKKARIPKEIEKLANIIRCGEKTVSLSDVSKYLSKHGYIHVLVEGGPTLLGSFFKEDLIDEIFLTLAPKIINGHSKEFFTMNDGELLNPKQIRNWKLLSFKNVKNELFLRYQRN